MSEIKRCENCGNEQIEIINRKGDYICGKCGRDTERLKEIEHDAEIRAKAIDEFAERLKGKAEEILKNPDIVAECKKCTIWTVRDIDEIAEQLKKEGAV